VDVRPPRFIEHGQNWRTVWLIARRTWRTLWEGPLSTVNISVRTFPPLCARGSAVRISVVSSYPGQGVYGSDLHRRIALGLVHFGFRLDILLKWEGAVLVEMF